ncbi:HlyD family efflux transporter periplasmic adaptor subunit [Egbenema bharatensis]|uniref:HlyD family efflux transporter periplasmic adaptor subunit n=1 Tax=Egbenema bharatensis TaxID=3463334 RepID=UPI003A861A9C
MQLRFAPTQRPDEAKSAFNRSHNCSHNSSGVIIFDVIISDAQFHSSESNSTSNSTLNSLSDLEASLIQGGSVAPVDRPSRPHADAQPVDAQPAKRSTQSSEHFPGWSPALQNVLDQPPSTLPLRVMLAGIAFCGAFGAWAWFGQVQEVSQAQGSLVPEGEVYQVQPVAQGEVIRLAVEEGQYVEAGQVIATLDDRLAETEVNRLQQSLVSYQFQMLQTQGLVDRIRSELDTRRAITAAEVRAQEAAIAQAQTVISTNHQTLSQRAGEMAAYEARLERLQPLVAEGVIAQEQLFEVEQALREHQRINVQSRGELQQSVEEGDRLQAELMRRQAEGQRSELETQQRLQQLEVELAQIQSNITETESLLQAAQTQLSQMHIHAPVSGIVSTLNIRNTGEVAQPGQTIAEIAPDGVPLVLSAMLPSREAGFVQEGMPVQVKFDAFPYQDFGVISGRVESISPDARMHEQMGAVYQIEVALDQHAVNGGDAGEAIEFRAGQTASAEIVTRRRRIMDVILEPMKRLQESGINL